MIPILGKAINYKDFLPNVLLGAHRVGWWNKDKVHHHLGMETYDSADPATCDAELTTLKSYGVDWIEHLDHGQNSGFHKSVIEMAIATQRAGMGFSVNFGSGVGATTQNYIDAVTYAALTFFPLSNYMMEAGRPLVKFFGPPAAVDFVAVRNAISSANPLFLFNFTGGFTRAGSDGAYGWPRPQKYPDGTAKADDFGLTDLLAFRDAAAANSGKVAVHGIFGKFFDPNPKDPTKSVWDITQPVRRLNPQDGLVALLTAKLVPATAKYVLIATVDDFEEGTAVLHSQGILD